MSEPTTMTKAEAISVIDDLTRAIAFSEMFGCKNEYQAKVMAYSCVYLRMAPMNFVERYHLIGGKDLSMKAEAMLAGFRNIGGRYRIVQADGDACEIHFIIDGQTVPFRIAWDDIKDESWTKDRDGNIKQNYASPFSRSDMLWARVVSRAVKRLAPEVVVGRYTEAEISDFRGLDYTPEHTVPDVAPDPAVVEPVQSEPMTSTPPQEPPQAPTEPKVDPVRESIWDLTRKLGGTADTLKEVLVKKYGVQTLGLLTDEQAADLHGRLRAKAQLEGASVDPAPSETGPVAPEAELPPQAPPAGASKDTLDAIRSYMLAMNVPMEAQSAALARRGVKSYEELDQATADSVLESVKLKAAEMGVVLHAGTVDDPVPPEVVAKLRGLVGEIVQSQPDFATKLKAKLAAAGIDGIAGLTVRESQMLEQALMTKQMEQFFDASITGWQAKNSDTSGQAS